MNELDDDVAQYIDEAVETSVEEHFSRFIGDNVIIPRRLARELENELNGLLGGKPNSAPVTQQRWRDELRSRME